MEFEFVTPGPIEYPAPEAIPGPSSSQFWTPGRGNSIPDYDMFIVSTLSDLSWKMRQKKEDTVSNTLSGKTAVVTGGSRGIGAAIAARLASMGAKVVICGRDRERLAKSAANIGCEAVPCDVSDWKSVESLASAVKQDHGGLDILVNNAGVADFGRPLHELPPDRWDAMINTNLRGVYYAIRAFAPLMISRGGGHIVNISSIASKNALPGGAAYAATKWGLNGLSYSVAEELRGSNVRVSVVCPGSTDTELSPHAGKDPKKMLRGEDIAHVVAMLVTQSDNSFASEVVIRPTKKP